MEKLVNIINAERVLQYINLFNKDEQEVLSLRYGVIEDSKTLNEISKIQKMDEMQVKLLLRDAEKKLLYLIRNN